MLYFWSQFSTVFLLKLLVVDKKHFILVMYTVNCKVYGFLRTAINRDIFHEKTVLQYGQFAVQENEYQYLHFLQILIIFATKTTNFVNFLLYFLQKKWPKL